MCNYIVSVRALSKCHKIPDKALNADSEPVMMVRPYNLLTFFNLHAASDIAYCHCSFLTAPGKAIGKAVTLAILVITRSISGKVY